MLTPVNDDVSARTVLRTACTRDCPDACAMLAHVDHGVVTRLQGDPAHPVTRGFLCFRTDQFLHRQYSPERLTTPLLRVNGALVPATWDEALDRIATDLLRIRAESGPAAIFHYRSGGSLGMIKSTTDHFFSLFGPVTTKRGDICSGAGDAAQLADFGDEDANDLDDLLHARAVILWGKNPHVSGPHLLPVLNELRRKGVPIALVDPVRHRGAGLADLVVQPRPGGDFALAMAVAQVLFTRGHVHPDAGSWCDHLDAFRALAFSRTVAQRADEAGVTVAEVEALAALYGANAPAAILVGWGMQRRRNGAAIVRALDALGAVTGNVGVSGGGVSFYFKRRGAFDTSWVDVSPPPRTVCEPLFGAEVLAAHDPPVRAVWITAGNPVVMLPDSGVVAEALRTRELVVVVDAFLTDTAKLATVVLPTTTFLEEDDLVGAYGHHYLNRTRPVAAPHGQSRSDHDILRALAPRVGLGDVFTGEATQWLRRMSPHVPLERFDDPEPVRSPRGPRVAFEGRVFATPTKRVNLVCDEPVAPCEGDAEFPLLLHALSTSASQCSQWSPAEPDDALTATVHPDAAMGCADGALATLRSRVGSLTVRVRHDATLRREVLLLPKGGSVGRGRSANALTRAAVSDHGEGAALYEEPVRLDPIAG